MVSYYDELEIEDFAWDDVAKVYHYPCPCGDRFEISKAQLRDGEEIATCPSCSLIVRVVYDYMDYEDYETTDDEEGDESEEETTPTTSTSPSPAPNAQIAGAGAEEEACADVETRTDDPAILSKDLGNLNLGKGTNEP
ncbi:Diphthamide biosynthesis protein 3 [Vanrija pseudolonga]|uniref:Diphthamide biosynthesis protein 3 n=1 Tax=Vanrija pseudolonga TaxID=143232 RepID=A0AAF1BI60_9TREE|nr:Diphthamide biosynthesis protein 3 [Vanrija pseudolonga]